MKNLAYFFMNILQPLAKLCLGVYLLECNVWAVDLSCLPTHLVTTISGVYRGEPRQSFATQLLSASVDGIFITEAKAEVEIRAAGEIGVRLHYPASSEMTGIPYQVFAIELKLDGYTEYFFDLTDGCVGEGASLSPGRVLELPTLKLAPDRLARCRERCSVRVRVWGFL